MSAGLVLEAAALAIFATLVLRIALWIGGEDLEDLLRDPPRK